jgi:hypothetical protein
LIAAVSTAESRENEDEVGSLTLFPLTGIPDQDSDKNLIIPTVIAPFSAPEKDTSLPASLYTEDSSGIMKSNSPQILEKEELDRSERRNDIEIKVSPLSLTPPHKPVNEKRQSLSARNPRKVSSPNTSNSKFASPNVSKSTTSSPRVMIKEEKAMIKEEKVMRKEEKTERRKTRAVSLLGSNLGENERVQAVITSPPADRIKGQENALATPPKHRQNIPLRSTSIISPSGSQPQPPVRRKSIISPSSSQPQPPVRRKTMSSDGMGSIGKQRSIIEKEFNVKNNVTMNDDIEVDIVTEETAIGGKNRTDETLV